MVLKSSNYFNLTVYPIALVNETSLVKNYKTKTVAFTVQVSQPYYWYFGYVELWKS